MQLNIRRITGDRIVDLDDFVGCRICQGSDTYCFFFRSRTSSLRARDFLLQLSTNTLEFGFLAFDSLLALFLLLDCRDDERRQCNVSNQHRRYDNALRREVFL